jgi:hypothetical protein
MDVQHGHAAWTDMQIGHGKLSCNMDGKRHRTQHEVAACISKKIFFTQAMVNSEYT